MMPLAANAVSFEAGVSSTNYGTQGDNVWYQQGVPHVLNTKTYGFSAGLTGVVFDASVWGVDWHTDYVNLGHVSSTCSCTPIDSNYDTKTHQVVPNPIPVANAQFVGNGNAQGVAFTLEVWRRVAGLRVGFEAGLFPYRPSWDVSVYDWQVQPGVSQALHVSTPHSLQLGQVIGVSVGRGGAALALKHYFLPTRFDSQHSPAIWKGATVVEFKYKF
jgi:hypothetical protein